MDLNSLDVGYNTEVVVVFSFLRVIMAGSGRQWCPLGWTWTGNEEGVW